MKDVINSQYYFLYYSGLVHFISIFAPPIPFYFAYWITYPGIFLLYFNVVSLFVCAYVHYMYVFYHEDFKFVQVSFLRLTTLLWKFSLTIFAFFVDIFYPLQDMLVLRVKGDNHDR